MQPLLSRKEIAELMKVSVRTVDTWVKDGTIPIVKLPGKSIRFDESQIEKWKATRSINSKPIGQ